MNRYIFSATATFWSTVLAVPADAADTLAQTVSRESTRSLYMALIRQARTDGRARAAIAYLDDFDRQHPDDRNAQLLRINCLLDLDQIAAARTALERIPATDRSGPTLAMRGHVLAAEGNWKQATEQYAAALEASPADALIVNALGYSLLRAGQWAKGIENLRSARDLAPDDAVVRNNLILALTVTGRIGEAEVLLAQVSNVQEKARLRQQVAGEAARLAATGTGLGSLGS
jgi:Flp pilus assembly protein TadD